MAKVAFSKLKCKVNEEVKIIDFNGETIEVKQYLPVQEKLGMIGDILEAAHEEDYNYANPIKIEIFTNLYMIWAYTNITCTDKQKLDIPKLYDAIYSSGLLAFILEAIPADEREYVKQSVYTTMNSVYTYQNSTIGVLQALKNNSIEMDILNANAESLQEELSGLAESSLVKDIMPLLGLNSSIIQ